MKTDMALPNSWCTSRLVDVCEIILGQSPPGDTYNAEGNGLPFFQGKTEFGDYYPTPRKWCSTPTKIAEPEDILVSVRAPVGPTNLCPSRACIGRGLAAIRPRNGMPSRYVLYALRATVNALTEKATGTTFEAVNGSDLRAHLIPVAPLPEQHRIVSEIEKQFTRLEAGVSALKRVQANLKRYRAAVLKAACEGKLVSTEAELAGRHRSYESGSELLTRILAERRKNWAGRGKYKEPAAPDTTNLPKLPEGWVWTSLASLAELKNGDRSKSYPSRSAFVSVGIPFVNAGHLEQGRVQLSKMNYISEERFALLQAGKIATGDILFCLRGSLGKVALVSDIDRGAIASSLVIVRSHLSDLTSYMFYYLSSYWAHQMIMKYNNGSAQPNLSAADLAIFALPLPPLAEQTRIVAEVERRLSVVDELEATVSGNLKHADCLRQAVLQKAFKGELT